MRLLLKTMLVIVVVALASTGLLPCSADDVIPVGTKILIELKSDLDYETVAVGQKIESVVRPLPSAEVSVPEGTTITGIVSKVGRPAHLDRSGSFDVVFNEAILPNGEEHSVAAVGVHWGGVIHVRRDAEDVPIDSATYVVCRLHLGPPLTAEQQQAEKLSSETTTFTAKKGRPLHLMKGDQFKLELCEDLRLPAHIAVQATPSLQQK